MYPAIKRHERLFSMARRHIQSTVIDTLPPKERGRIGHHTSIRREPRAFYTPYTQTNVAPRDPRLSMDEEMESEGKGCQPSL
jgi:hypothetical protein